MSEKNETTNTDDKSDEKERASPYSSFEIADRKFVHFNKHGLRKQITESQGKIFFDPNKNQIFRPMSSTPIKYRETIYQIPYTLNLDPQGPQGVDLYEYITISETGIRYSDHVFLCASQEHSSTRKYPKFEILSIMPAKLTQGRLCNLYLKIDSDNDSYALDVKTDLYMRISLEFDKEKISDFFRVEKYEVFKCSTKLFRGEETISANYCIQFVVPSELRTSRPVISSYCDVVIDVFAKKKKTTESLKLCDGKIGWMKQESCAKNVLDHQKLNVFVKSVNPRTGSVNGGTFVNIIVRILDSTKLPLNMFVEPRNPIFKLDVLFRCCLGDGEVVPIMQEVVRVYSMSESESSGDDDYEAGDIVIVCKTTRSVEMKGGDVDVIVRWRKWSSKPLVKGFSFVVATESGEEANVSSVEREDSIFGFNEFMKNLVAENYPVCEELLLSGKFEFDVNSVDNFGNTALHFAYFYGNHNMIMFLINNKANVKFQNHQGTVPSILKYRRVEIENTNLECVKEETNQLLSLSTFFEYFFGRNVYLIPLKDQQLYYKLVFSKVIMDKTLEVSYENSRHERNNHLHCSNEEYLQKLDSFLRNEKVKLSLDFNCGIDPNKGFGILGEEFFTKLLELLLVHKGKIVFIGLRDNHLHKFGYSNTDFDVLTKVGELAGNIRELVLMGNKLTNENLVQLLGGVNSVQFPSLRILNLGQNEIGTEGFTTLNRFLRKNTSLTKLVIRGNKINRMEQFYSDNFLSDNSTLMSLDLSLNKFGLHGQENRIRLTLWDGLKSGTNTIVDLNLNMCDLGDQGMKNLCGVLNYRDTCLMFVSVVNNKITSDGIRFIAGVKNKSLISLNLSVNAIERDDALVSFLEHNKSVVSLNLENNPIHNNGISKKLRGYLERNSAYEDDFLRNHQDEEYIRFYLHEVPSLFYNEKVMLRLLNSDNRFVFKYLVDNFNGKSVILFKKYFENFIITKVRENDPNKTFSEKHKEFKIYFDFIYMNRLAMVAETDKYHKQFARKRAEAESDMHTIKLARDEYLEHLKHFEAGIRVFLAHTEENAVVYAKWLQEAASKIFQNTQYNRRDYQFFQTPNIYLAPDFKRSVCAQFYTNLLLFNEFIREEKNLRSPSSPNRRRQRPRSPVPNDQQEVKLSPCEEHIQQFLDRLNQFRKPLAEFVSFFRDHNFGVTDIPFETKVICVMEEWSNKILDLIKRYESMRNLLSKMGERDYAFDPQIFKKYQKEDFFLAKLKETPDYVRDLATRKTSVLFLSYLLKNDARFNPPLGFKKAIQKESYALCELSCVNTNSLFLIIVLGTVKGSALQNANKVRKSYVKKLLREQHRFSPRIRRTLVEAQNNVMIMYNQVFHPFYLDPNIVGKANKYFSLKEQEIITRKDDEFMKFLQTDLKGNFKVLEFEENSFIRFPNFVIDISGFSKSGASGRVSKCLVHWEGKKFLYAMKKFNDNELDVFENEVSVMKKIRDIKDDLGTKNIVRMKFYFKVPCKRKRILDNFETEQVDVTIPFIVMERCQMNLRDFYEILKTGGGHEWKNETEKICIKLTDKDKEILALIVLYEICCGMRLLHALSIYHRDLKPENVLINLSGDFIESVKLCDFGYSRESFKTMYETRVKNAKKGPDDLVVFVQRYTPKEVLENRRYRIRRVDAFSFGKIGDDLVDYLKSFPDLRFAIRECCSNEDPDSRKDFNTLMGILDSIFENIRKKSIHSYKLRNYIKQGNYRELKKQNFENQEEGLLHYFVEKVDEEEWPPRKGKPIKKIYKLLLEKVDVQYVNTDGNTFLHLVVKLDRKKLLKFLLNHRFTIFLSICNVENVDGDTALMMAMKVESVNAAVVQKLIHHGSFFEQTKLLKYLEKKSTKFRQIHGRRPTSQEKKDIEVLKKFVGRTDCFTLQIKQLKHLKNFVPLENIEKLDKIGGGAYGTVYRAKLKSKSGSDEIIAIKEIVIGGDIEEAEKKLEAFMLINNERTILNQLSELKNDNILTYRGISFQQVVINREDKSDLFRIFLVTDFCDRADLQDFYDRNPRTIPLEMKIDFLLQTAKGLKYLYKKFGIIHRDLKPSQLLLKTQNGKLVIKIADFGLSINQKFSHLRHEAAGTAEWCAPEIFNKSINTVKYTTQSDIYAFGLIAYFCIFEENPFMREKLQMRVDCIHNEVIRPKFFQPSAQFLYGPGGCKSILSEELESKDKSVLKGYIGDEFWENDKEKFTRNELTEIHRKFVADVLKHWNMLMDLTVSDFAPDSNLPTIFHVSKTIDFLKEDYKMKLELKRQLRYLPEVTLIMRKCWTPDPKVRYQSFEEIVTKLKKVHSMIQKLQKKKKKQQ